MKSLKGKSPKMKPWKGWCIVAMDGALIATNRDKATMASWGMPLVRVEVREVSPRKKVKRG